jgi:hypothetical protein
MHMGGMCSADAKQARVSMGVPSLRVAQQLGREPAWRRGYHIKA